ncbi:hypothetical protein [Empedobacter sp.]|uniref:hypothetical protein n=1 Tax=Empedobacter sp. TaxID=1927715 RepID=UPI0028A2BDAC|nr:hypothetical protein [Empedobacter sp.]
MKRILFFVLLFYSFSINAQDYNYNEWTYVTSSVKDQDYYVRSIDRKKPIKQFNKISIWTKMVGNTSYWNEKQSKEVFVKDGYTLIKWEFDCKNIEGVMRSIYTYDSKDNLLYSTDSSFNGEWNSFLPDSVMDEVLNFSCENY